MEEEWRMKFDNICILGPLQECIDVFLEEVLGLPPKREIDFSIRLAPGATPVSKVPYKMSAPKLLELKL